MQFNFRIKYLIIILFLIMGYSFLSTNRFPENRTLCIFKNVTGIPCPACGSTRATILLLHGDLKGSLMMNPIGIIATLFFILSVIWMISDIIRNKETFLPFLKTDWNIFVKVLIFSLLSANWIWNISKGL